MDVAEQWYVDRPEKGFGAPLPGAPNVRYLVLTKPLRFELWGAHEDLVLPIHALSLAAIPKLYR